MTSVPVFQPKTCLTCEAQYIPVSGFQKYCSPACKPPRRTGLCAEPECGKVGRLVRGYCTGHYKQVQMHGVITSAEIRFKGSQGSALDEPTSWQRDPETGCLIWQRTKTRNGYGIMGTTQGGVQRMWLVHRLMYERHVGPIPEGLEIDHLCNNRLCAEPSHLEPVTRSENNRRAYARKYGDACKRGHPWEGPDADVYWTSTGQRVCNTCKKAAMRAWYLVHRAHATMEVAEGEESQT